MFSNELSRFDLFLNFISKLWVPYLIIYQTLYGIGILNRENMYTVHSLLNSMIQLRFVFNNSFNMQDELIRDVYSSHSQSRFSLYSTSVTIAILGPYNIVIMHRQ